MITKNETNLDLLLINPPASLKIYQGLADEYASIEPPYLAALTAGFVRKNGFTVSILDANALGLDINQTVKKAIHYDPHLIHIVVHGQQPSASSQLMGIVEDFCRKTKEENENIKILLTGTHPSALPEKTIKEVKCDFVGYGEGFFTVLGLLQNKPLSEIPGLWYNNQGKIVSPKTMAKDIEEKDLDGVLPQAAWDLLPMDKYRAHNWHCLDDVDKRKPYASIYTSFGCPYKCTFCCINAPFEVKRIRCFSPEYVIKTLSTLIEEYGVRNIKIIDEMFVLKPSHYEGICDKILESNYGDRLNFWAYARVDTIKESILGKLKKSGFNWLALGIESGSKHVRDGVEKGRFGLEQIRQNVEKIKNADINIIGNYIFGLPDDTLESMQETLDLALELKCEWANFYSAMAYPGSQLHLMAENRTLPLPPGWDNSRPLLPEGKNGPGWTGYSQHAYEALPLPTQYLTPDQIIKFRDQAHIIYFTNEDYLNMIENRFGEKAVNHIRKMIQFKLKRKLLGD